MGIRLCMKIYMFTLKQLGPSGGLGWANADYGCGCQLIVRLWGNALCFIKHLYGTQASHIQSLNPGICRLIRQKGTGLQWCKPVHIAVG